MAILLPDPWTSVISPSGQPIVGASAYFYQTGTLTPQPVYADAGLTTPLTQPLTSDSAGRFPTCYLSDALTTAYRMQVYDNASPANLLRDIDPLNPQSATAGGLSVVTNIAALRAGSFTSGALFVEGYYAAGDAGRGWFAYAPSDTSSADNGGTIIVDSAGHRFYRVLNGAVTIDHFGAKLDSGATDNATYINAATAAAVDVQVPGSTSGAFYAFGSTLQVRSGGRLSGQGKTSYLKATNAFGTSSPLVSNYTTSPANLAARDDGVTIENLTIDANSQGLANVSLTATQNFTLRRLWLLNAGTNGVSIHAKVTDATIYPQNGWIEDVYVYTATSVGMLIDAGAEITVLNLLVDTATSSGVSVTAAGSSSLGRNIRFVNPVIRNCGSGAGSNGILFFANGSSTWGELSVTGGVIDSQTGTGLKADSTSAVTVNGLTVKSATVDGFYLNNASYVSLSGVYATSCTRDGIRLDGTTAHASISGGTLTGCGGYGVNEVNGLVDYTSVWGTARAGNSSGKQSLSGANSICDDVFTSGGLTIASSTGNQAVAHGLGMTPKSVGYYLKCVAGGGDNGYALNELVGGAMVTGGSGGHTGVNVSIVSNVNVGYAIADLGLQMVPAAGGAPFVPSTSNWQIVLVAKGYP